jgi:hypothetical protein
MSGRIAWPRYLALCVAGLAMIFAGALASLPISVAVGLVVGGTVLGALGFRLWMGALVHKYGSGRMLLWLVAFCVVLALLGLLIPKE